MKIGFNQSSPNKLRFKDHMTFDTRKEAKNKAINWRDNKDVQNDVQMKDDNLPPYQVAVYQYGGQWHVADGKHISEIPEWVKPVIMERNN